MNQNASCGTVTAKVKAMLRFHFRNDRDELISVSLEVIVHYFVPSAAVL